MKPLICFPFPREARLSRNLADPDRKLGCKVLILISEIRRFARADHRPPSLAGPTDAQAVLYFGVEDSRGLEYAVNQGDVGRCFGVVRVACHSGLAGQGQRVARDSNPPVSLPALRATAKQKRSLAAKEQHQWHALQYLSSSQPIISPLNPFWSAVNKRQPCSASLHDLWTI